MSGRTVEPGLRHALRFWWAFTWRWPLLMLIALLPIALLLALVKPGPQAVMAVVAWVTWPIAAWAQIDAFRRLLRTDFKGFSVRLLERSHE